jgi:hypothetical protein
VGIGFAAKAVDEETIQKAFGSATGWARYAPNCWIISTSRTAESIADAIRKVVSTDDSVFVCKVDLGNNSGYLHKEIWKWIADEMK